MHATDGTSQVSKYYFLEKQAWLFGSFYQCRKAVFFLLESINITQICFLFFSLLILSQYLSQKKE